jgi:hypothetical protein
MEISFQRTRPYYLDCITQIPGAWLMRLTISGSMHLFRFTLYEQTANTDS